MNNPIVSLYSVKYSYTEGAGEDQVLLKREAFFSTCGGWEAINDLTATFIAQLDGITDRPRVEQVSCLGPTLVVDPDLLNEVRATMGANPEKAGEFIQPLADIHLSSRSI